MSWCTQTGRAVAHKMRASFFAFACRQSFDHPGAVVCDRLRVNTCTLAWVVAAVKHDKANTTLKYLYLEINKVGNEGAAALAEAVKVADLTCGLKWRVLGFDKCCFATMHYELAFQSCCMKEHAQPITSHRYVARSCWKWRGSKIVMEPRC